MKRWKILDKIGEGAHGVVYKAKCTETGTIVAIKKIIIRQQQSHYASSNFPAVDVLPLTLLREYQALFELQHVNVSCSYILCI